MNEKSKGMLACLLVFRLGATKSDNVGCCFFVANPYHTSHTQFGRPKNVNVYI